MDSQQEGYGVSRSWFYLTLWHGTPEEFTTYYDIEIENLDFANANVHHTDSVSAVVDKAISLTAKIDYSDNATTDVITQTEVNWLVN